MAESRSGNLKRPELRLTGNMSENFKNFELRFDDYCIQANYRDLEKSPSTERDSYYKSKQLEISALRSAMPDEALQVIRYTIDPQISATDKDKPWIWMQKLREHYTGTTGSSLMTDRFRFWHLSQNPSETVQEWEVKVRQAGTLCEYQGMTDEMNRDKFVFGLQEASIRTELLKTHLKADGSKKALGDVVTEAKALESAQKTNKLISDNAKSIEEQVNELSHKDMKLKREPGTCFWCGRNGQHPWKDCKANGATCHRCGGKDHLSTVCLETPQSESSQRGQSQRGNRGNRGNRGRGRGGGGQRAGHFSGRGGNSSRGRGNRGRGVYIVRGGNSGRQYGQEQLHYVNVAEGDTYYTDDYNPDEYEVHAVYELDHEQDEILTVDLSSEQTEEEMKNCEVHYVYAVENVEETSVEMQEVHQVQSKPGKKYFANLHTSVDGNKFHHLPFQIDTAATCNTMSESVLKQKFPEAKMDKANVVLKPYGKESKPIKALGKVQLICERKKNYYVTNFVVMRAEHMGSKPALLSGEDCEKMGIVKIDADEVVHAVETTDANEASVETQQTEPEIVTATSQTTRDKRIRFPLRRPLLRNRTAIPNKKPRLPTTRPLEKQDILKQYASNFEGVGTLGPPVKFKCKPGVTPVQMPIHRVPITKRLKEKLALRKLEEAGFITREKNPTEWCSNILCRESPKKFRVCIDPSQTVNKAIERPMFQMPTLKEQLHELKKAKVFSVIDVKDGFFHVALDHDSSLMTTMHTSFGRYRWLVLPNGISSAPEEFQMRLLQVLEGLSGIIVIADDILVFGSGDTYEEAEADHDKNIAALMDRAEEKNLKFNLAKFQFKKKEVKYVGHILTSEGIKADPDKVKAIKDMPAPTDKAGVRRFIGMINFLSPYCENLSSIIRPLTELTKQGMSFIWSEVQEKAFQDAKRLIIDAPVLQYFDLEKPVLLQVDASKAGLGGVLMQPNDEGRMQPVSYTSCSLNPTEKGYPQIEKECLAICNAFSKYDQWLYGKREVKVHTDHQPLETIFKKPLNKAPARLQKMMMNLQRYQFDLEYKKGTSLHIADALSRAFLPTATTCETTEFEVFRVEVENCYEENHPNFCADTQNKLKLETKQDQTLQKLISVMLEGWPTSRKDLPKELGIFWNYRDELTANDGIIYKGKLVLIPNSMIKSMLGKIHKHHFGSASSIRMAREVFFWPGMRGHIDDMCKSCAECAKFGTATPKEPMKSLPIPTLPWQIVSQDLFELESKDYLVTVCHFSDWIEVDELKSADSHSVIQCTKAHFARFGVPQICHTDNGSQFISNAYRKFSEDYGFKHTRSSPYHSKGNGRAEAAVKVCKAMLKKSDDIQAAMLNYRNTPQQGHSYSPVQRMMNHRTRSMLPTSNVLLSSKIVDNATVNKEITQKRAASKKIYDRTAGVELQKLEIGTHAYAKPPPAARGKPWEYSKIIQTDGNRSYTLLTPNSTIRRNRCQLRPAAAPQQIVQRPIIRPIIKKVVESNPVAVAPQTETLHNKEVRFTEPVEQAKDIGTTVAVSRPIEAPRVEADTPKRPVRVRRLPLRFENFQMGDEE